MKKILFLVVFLNATFIGVRAQVEHYKTVAKPEPYT